MDDHQNPYRSPTAANDLPVREKSRLAVRNVILMLPAIAVAGWVGLFYGYVARVTFSLGRFPRSIAEHAGLEDGLHWHLLAYSMILLIFAMPILTFAIFFLMAANPKNQTASPVIGLLFAWGLALFVIYVDPGGHFQWFLD